METKKVVDLTKKEALEMLRTLDLASFHAVFLNGHHSFGAVHSENLTNTAIVDYMNFVTENIYLLRVVISTIVKFLVSEEEE